MNGLKLTASDLPISHHGFPYETVDSKTFGSSITPLIVCICYVMGVI